jgi:EAL domain-containing protein (putative c-di-GMP-specific phosphodiesterase class I)
LAYQPLLDLRRRSITGVEALLRWRHPELGEIGPETLIRAAEGSGQIERIGAWILLQACTAAMTWRRHGLPLRVAVNVSGVQLRDPNLAGLIRRILEDTGWPAEQLELELTETGPIGEIGVVAPMVERLRELGVSLAIDDFGAGHTGLGHLRQLPLDALKIDRSLVTGLEGEEDAAIAGSLIELGHRLRLRVVAEGVETAAQLAILERLGCDEAQGHIVGAPASQAEMAARLDGRRAPPASLARRRPGRSRAGGAAKAMPQEPPAAVPGRRG